MHYPSIRKLFVRNPGLNFKRSIEPEDDEAHVSKEDVLIGTLTVKETVYLSARLRLPVSIPRKEKMLIAHRTIQDMGLWECAVVRVGSTFCQSGHPDRENRRLSVALELLTLPHLLYLDDSLTGLGRAGCGPSVKLRVQVGQPNGLAL